MTKEELIKSIEESIQSCTNEDEEYIRGWKCAMVNVLEKVKELSVEQYPLIDIMKEVTG